MRYKGLKGKAWEAVRKYVRAKEKDCYTCPAKNLESYNANAGHYRPVAIVGSNNRRAWLPQIIHLQCSHCNGAGQGEQVKYRTRLVKEYGEQFVSDYDKAVDAKTYDAIKNWQAIIDEYETLYIAIKQGSLLIPSVVL